jgi:hypothetical protein
MGPVLYLDIDDTLLSWADGKPRPVPAAGGFVRWALSRFEVRWLTTWCPSGEMPDRLLADLARMLEMDARELRGIRGCDRSDSGIKADGIAWMEHLVLGRPFVWVENRGGLSDRDLEILDQAGLRDNYIECDVTVDETAIARVRRLLERRFDFRPDQAALEDVA